MNGRRTKAAPPSLLEKLLASDVRRESLLTIQLLDYIVWDAQFFDRTDDETQGKIDAKDR
jgi:hypothetical protein